MTKRTRLRRVPAEFDDVLEGAKKEYKALTGRKQCSDADAFRYISAVTKSPFSYKKDFRKRRSSDEKGLSFEGGGR